MSQNTIKVDRGQLFEILQAAEALLDGRGPTHLAVTPQERLDEAKAACEDLREELFG